MSWRMGCKYHLNSSYKKGRVSTVPACWKYLPTKQLPSTTYFAVQSRKAVCNLATSITLIPFPLYASYFPNSFSELNVPMRETFGDLHSFFSDAVPSLVEV